MSQSHGMAKNKNDEHTIDLFTSQTESEKKRLNNKFTVAQRYTLARITTMIKSFKHKGLKKFFTTGNTAGIQQAHKARLEERLTALHTAFSVEDVNIPGWRLHALKGDREGQWAINVSGNWRVVFEFENGHAYVVNYEDYH